MRVTGDLGFSSLVLVVLCLVVPVIGFVIRWKWLHAVARKEEIKRLLILASEEAERAEHEASYAYGAVSVVKSNQCVVCYCPTTTRCARCKAVRYCSGKCQIIHWRQGHKEECHPPSTTPWIDDVASDLGQKAVEQSHLEICGEKSEIEDAQSKTPFKEPPLPDSSRSPEVACAKDDNIRVDPLAEVNITDSNSESSSNSFSGFSASPNSSEASDDASVCESIISNENERSEGHDFVDPALDMLDTTSGDDNTTGVNISSSPKFARLVDSVDGFSTCKFNQSRPDFSSEESKIASNGNSSLSMCKGATIEPHTVSSGFWDETLYSRGTKDVANDDAAQSHSNHYSLTKESDAQSSSGSSFSTLSSSQAQVPEAKSSISGNAFPNSVSNNMPSAGSALSENSRMDSSKTRNFLSTNSKGSSGMNHDTASVSDRLESREDNFQTLSSSYVHRYSNVGEDSKYADPSRTRSNLSSAGSKASNHVVENSVGTSHQSKLCASANAPLVSKPEGRSHHRSKSGNYGVEAGITTSSQGTICYPNSKNGLKTSVLKVVDQFRGSTLSKRFPPAFGSDIAGRYSDKGIFPYDLFVKLYNWNKVELQPFGLINCGNSCYANAVLQCLAFTPPLTAYLLQGLHSKACAKKKWCFMCEFESLILKSKEGKSPLSPVGILSHLQNIGNQLGNGREEDAHEFLRHAIDTMQSVCLTEAGINTSGLLEEETTLMGLTFGGYLRSKIKCMKCGGTSERQERMMDLTVEIEGEITTLEEALRQFTSTETLDEENKYHCARCKSYEKAKKKLTVSEAPNVLTVALKRFQSGKFGKLNKPIRFPEILDLAPYMSGTSDKSPIYRLYGVVVHLDIMNAAFSGHYVCYVKNIQNKWFKVDDSTVTAVESERVLTKGAYMLLYARCSPRAPRSIRSMMVSPDTKSKAMNGKTSTMTSRNASKISGAAEYSTSSVSADGSPTLDSFYSRFHHLKRILEEDSSSDDSSLISNNSDEGSCSTDSTRGSTSTDDFSDYIFGDSLRGCSSIWRNSDSDTSSSSSSPIYSKHSPLADMDRYASGSYETKLQTQAGTIMEEDGPMYRLPNGISRVEDIERKGVSHLHCDNTTRHRKLDSSRNSSSNFRDGDGKSLKRSGANYFNDVLCRKSGERTD